MDEPVLPANEPTRDDPQDAATALRPEAPRAAGSGAPAAEAAAGALEPETPPAAALEIETAPPAAGEAAATLEPATPTAPAPEAEGAGVPMAVACQRFGIAPYVLRGLLDEYPDWLPLAGDRLLAPESVERVEAILRWRREGLSPDEIRHRLDQGPAAPNDPMTALLDRLAHLQTELARSEQHRVEDRDRMMMALVRTQQEIQHLRYDLAGEKGRKGRRRGFWRRLFGS